MHNFVPNSILSRFPASWILLAVAAVIVGCGLVHRDFPENPGYLRAKAGIHLPVLHMDSLQTIIPARSWSTHEQRALFVVASRCSNAAKHDADLKNVLDSFRLVRPF
jgi:hypothetical protein